MTKKIKRNLLLVLLGLVAFELALLFAVTDLNIWLAIGNVNAPFAIFMEVIGELAAPILLIVCGMVISFYFKTQLSDPHHTQKFYVGLVCIAGGQGYCLLTYFKLNVWYAIICVIVNALLLFFFFTLLKKLNEGRLFQLYCVAITAIIYGVIVLITITIIKECWGRVRPREMVDVAEFTRFYLPQGFTGSRSFPSGHVSNACIIYTITMLAPLFKKLWAKILIYALPIIWILLMAINRVVIGAHFASDTLFAIIISITLFYIIKPIVIRKIGENL